MIRRAVGLLANLVLFGACVSGALLTRALDKIETELVIGWLLLSAISPFLRFGLACGFAAGALVSLTILGIWLSAGWIGVAWGL